MDLVKCDLLIFLVIFCYSDAEVNNYMATSTLNISLPDSMRQFVEEKITSGGYGTISEYVRELIRTDQRMEQSSFDALIAKSLNSGESSPFTKSDIDEAHRVVKARIAERKNAK